MQKVNLLTLAVALLCVFLVGCSKEDIVDRANDTNEAVETGKDYSITETAFEDVQDLVDGAAQQEAVLNGFTDIPVADHRDCADINIETTTTSIFPVTMTMDYGSGCVMNNGRTASGVITVVFTDRPRQAGAYYTITFTDFELDGHTISGTRTVTNNGTNSEGQLSFTVTVDNGQITFPDGTVFSYTTDRTRTLVEGAETKFETDGIAGINDDVWEITGTANGVNREGNNYEVEVSEPLRRAMNCRWLTAGVMRIDTEVYNNTIVIDFGEGDCDDQAVVTVGLIQRTITMP